MHGTRRSAALARLQTGVLLASVAGVACGAHPTVPAGPAIAIFGESTRYRLGDPNPAATPWFDGATVSLAAARGERLGIQVAHRAPASPVSLAIEGATITGFTVTLLPVTRPSTSMYGGSRGAGRYAEGLTVASGPVASDPAYFEIVSTPGHHVGTLTVGATTYPVALDVATVELPPIAPAIWAYYDPRELGGAGTPANPGSPGTDDATCIARFRDVGIALSPDLDLASWPARRAALAGFPYVPVTVGDDPATIGAQVAAWIAATAGTGQVPFAIPIDEPRDHEARLRVRRLADAVRQAGGGPTTFLFAVTDAPQPEYGDAVDLYIAAGAAHLTGDRHARWTYNGTPPAAGSMVLDAETPGARTWGWIMYRYQIPVWYVWDALYWHDRHNRKRHALALPGRPLALDRDATSFDDLEDHGNLDGVLALPGCQPTLRMAAIRRGLQDRALLTLAARCDPRAADGIAAEVVPRALGDAAGAPAWAVDEATWERARRKLLALAGCK
ncbi:MAG: hypothetical protein NT062_37910 [Proteobacteria bacterium]|nr:hypothetical protein [Pseudomonadota bacterium]